MTSANEVMTLAEVAQYLQLAEKTVLRMVQRGEIPGAQGGQSMAFSTARDQGLARRPHAIAHSGNHCPRRSNIPGQPYDQ